jgi:hypothetical protein
MLVLLVASTLRDELPTIVFEQPDEVAKFHRVHGAALLGWAMS